MTDSYDSCETRGECTPVNDNRITAEVDVEGVLKRIREAVGVTGTEYPVPDATEAAGIATLHLVLNPTDPSCAE